MYGRIGQACTGYAHELDQAHHAIIDEIRNFIEITVAIEAAGGLLAVVTLGISEAVAQGGEVAEVTRAALAIRSIIEALSAVGTELRATLDAAGLRFSEVAANLKPILARQPEEVRLAAASDRGEIAVARSISVQTQDTVMTTAASTTADGAAVARLNKAVERGDIVARDSVGVGHAGIHKFPDIEQRKSQFFDHADLHELADTRGATAIVKPGGRKVYVVRAQTDIGIDRTTRLPTDICTVVRGRDGTVVTMFPGTSPKS